MRVRLKFCVAHCWMDQWSFYAQEWSIRCLQKSPLRKNTGLRPYGHRPSSLGSHSWQVPGHCFKHPRFCGNPDAYCLQTPAMCGTLKRQTSGECETRVKHFPHSAFRGARCCERRPSEKPHPKVQPSNGPPAMAFNSVLHWCVRLKALLD